MKPLTKEQMAGFTKMIAATRDHEINCTECASLAAEFAERQLAGLPLDGALAKVEQHLQICPECTEELQALKTILQSEQ
jgi:hypothetical protein